MSIDIFTIGASLTLLALGALALAVLRGWVRTPTAHQVRMGIVVGNFSLAGFTLLAPIDSGAKAFFFTVAAVMILIMLTLELWLKPNTH